VHCCAAYSRGGGLLLLCACVPCPVPCFNCTPGCALALALAYYCPPRVPDCPPAAPCACRVVASRSLTRRSWRRAGGDASSTSRAAEAMKTSACAACACRLLHECAATDDALWCLLHKDNTGK
jgi:hypothetical protein